MARRCPACKSLNVRRSSIRARGVETHHILLSPYRCRDCDERFWVVSHNAYLLAVIVVGAALAGAIGWHVWDFLKTADVQPAPAVARTSPIADLTQRAHAGDPAAEYELGRVHGTGDGVTRDEKEAWKWYERAARKGSVQAQYELALVLREGRGTIQDYEGARYWMLKAAEGGYPQAQYDLGVMYRNGNGVAVDNVQAYIWLNLAAAQGVPGAAPLRDATLSRLTPTEVTEAQAEARRLGEEHAKQSSASK